MINNYSDMMGYMLGDEWRSCDELRSVSDDEMRAYLPVFVYMFASAGWGNGFPTVMRTILQIWADTQIEPDVLSVLMQPLMVLNVGERVTATISQCELEADTIIAGSFDEAVTRYLGTHIGVFEVGLFDQVLDWLSDGVRFLFVFMILANAVDFCPKEKRVNVQSMLGSITEFMASPGYKLLGSNEKLLVNGLYDRARKKVECE